MTNVELSTFLQEPDMVRLVDLLRGMGVPLPDPIEDIQVDGSLPFMRWLVQETTAGLEASLPDSDPPGIILSTHRDIVCDPSLYNLARVEAGRPTTHIVLGTNLARKPWVRDLMAHNKALFIDRTLAGRAALLQQKQLSEDIARIVDDGGHVWIAQSPGRAKDGIDQTHAGLLRMLGLAWGGEEKGAAALDGLLRPLAVRYDVNPCDAMLVKEKVTGLKEEGDDEVSMREGLLGWKGRVRLAEGARWWRAWRARKVVCSRHDGGPLHGRLGCPGQWARFATAPCNIPAPIHDGDFPRPVGAVSQTTRILAFRSNPSLPADGSQKFTGKTQERQLDARWAQAAHSPNTKPAAVVALIHCCRVPGCERLRCRPIGLQDSARDSRCPALPPKVQRCPEPPPCSRGLLLPCPCPEPGRLSREAQSRPEAGHSATAAP